MKPLITVTLALLASMAVPPALAHAHLAGAQADAQLLKLVFSEGVEAAFSTVTVTDAEGHAVALQAVSTQADNPKVLLAQPSSPLAPGEYDGQWQVVSVDTHKSSGTFHFKIGQ
ncbi:copper resistance protein CopC [Pseudomonas typographi]|uniref:Copper resistance protein C n=1 Tax=Pseudomonas typographi TaxID=2715964 RepID=A0ABR7Z8L3_9PSED|nr:copper resistance protein CopC [Pseudomonas typographi]MBD1553878.1 copper resistance protein CopC [Pseudomonas typographi]MBD1590047.1 copper resistance protein CopC [Pseudomonas typographi]MBD1601713.1 copper resistance protein CopC [Pseudomonas typographi]